MVLVCTITGCAGTREIPEGPVPTREELATIPFASVNSGDWLKVRTAGDTAWSMLRPPVQSNSEFTRVWTLWEFPAWDKATKTRLMTLEDLDCRNRRIRALRTAIVPESGPIQTAGWSAFRWESFSKLQLIRLATEAMCAQLK